MGNADFYKRGDYNAVCSMCAGKFKASQLRKHWQGMYRCSRCWEPRQPQDFVKAPPPEQPPPWTQPPNDDFVQVCTARTRSAVPGSAGPGCAIPRFVFTGAVTPDTAGSVGLDPDDPSVWWDTGPAPEPNPSPTPPPDPPSGVSVLRAFGNNGTSLVVATSIDGGENWTEATLASINFGAVAYSPSLQRLVAIPTSGTTFYYSDDFGVSWTSYNGGLAVTDIIWSPTFNMFLAAVAGISSGIVFRSSTLGTGGWASLTGSFSRTGYWGMVDTGVSVLWVGNARTLYTTDGLVAAGPAHDLAATGFQSSVGTLAYIPGVGLIGADSAGAAVLSVNPTSGDGNWQLTSAALANFTSRCIHKTGGGVTTGPASAQVTLDGLNWTAAGVQVAMTPYRPQCGGTWFDVAEIFGAVGQSVATPTTGVVCLSDSAGLNWTQKYSRASTTFVAVFEFPE